MKSPAFNVIYTWRGSEVQCVELSVEIPVFEHGSEQRRAARQAVEHDMFVERVQPITLRAETI